MLFCILFLCEIKIQTKIFILFHLFKERNKLGRETRKKVTKYCDFNTPTREHFLDYNRRLVISTHVIIQIVRLDRQKYISI